VAWRDSVSAKLDVLTLREFHEQKRSNNSSGVPGVHFLKTSRQPDGVWQALLKLPNGKRASKTFSVRKFGRREAVLRSALAARQIGKTGGECHNRHSDSVTVVTVRSGAKSELTKTPPAQTRENSLRASAYPEPLDRVG